jgi:predicted deacylase
VPYDPADLAARFGVAGAAAGFRLERFGKIGDFPLVALTRPAPGQRPKIYISAGIHGDEPASPLALLELIEAGRLDDRASWYVCPLLNPTGLARGIRENAGGADLNRGYRNPQTPENTAHIAWLKHQPNFDLTISLHEDWEAKGFYLYELNPDRRASFAESIVRAASAIIPFDPSPLIDGREARAGIIRPNSDPAIREKWPESIYLRANHHAGLHYTLETPSAFPLEKRIAALRTAVETAVGLLLAEAGSPRGSQ